MITHHPNFELLFDYVSGALPEPMSLSVACHASVCKTCHDQLKKMEDLGGALIDGFEEPLQRDVELVNELDAMMARLDEDAAVDDSIDIDWDKATSNAVPGVVRSYLPANLDDLTWRHIGGKVSQYNLDIPVSGYKVSLMRFKAGSPMPIHTHKGSEITLVLTGGYSDGGSHFERGDYDLKDASHTHQPIVDGGEDCIALVVLDAPVVLAGPISRFLNPFFKL